MSDAWSERLSEYLDGSLSAPEKAELDQHLVGCGSCRHDLEELRRVVSWLKSDKADEANRFGFKSIRRQLSARKSRWLVAAPWAAAAVLAIVAGSLWLNRPAPVPQATYQQAVNDLEIVLRNGRGKLDPETQRKLEKSIAIIDQAIKQSEDGLARDSSNEFISRHLAHLRDAKLAALRDAAHVVRAKL